MAACRLWSGGSATPLEGTLQPPMRRAVTPRGTGLGAGDLAALSAVSGLRLQTFRPEHVADRIARALAAERLRDAAALTARMRGDGRVRERFRRSVAVSHSGFFRDPQQFEALEQRLLPRLLEHATRLRTWSAGCANGLELWSLAVVLSRLGVLDRAALLGSDLLEENLAVARAGVYDVVEITPALKARARWERRDLTLEAPPGGRFDLIMCRNVAIYFEPATKARVHRLLAGALAPGGVLMLGPLRAPRRSRGARAAPCRAPHLRAAAMTTAEGHPRSLTRQLVVAGVVFGVLQIAVFGLLIGAVRSANDANQRTNQVLGAVQTVSDLEKGVVDCRDGHARVRHHGPRRLPGPARRRPRADPRRGADDPDRGGRQRRERAAHPAVRRHRRVPAPMGRPGRHGAPDLAGAG